MALKVSRVGTRTDKTAELVRGLRGAWGPGRGADIMGVTDTSEW
jgi:hypothetical protein